MKRVHVSIYTVGLLFISITYISCRSASYQTRSEAVGTKKTYTGSATYYADHYQGKKTASGELYDRGKNTAAIRTNALPLPFGTMVEVSSIKNNKSVIVRVNDKMSAHAKAIIDLSYKAAKAIGLVNDGKAEVTIRVISEPKK